MNIKRKKKNVLLVILFITILLGGVLLAIKPKFYKEEYRFNISYLPVEFVDEYFSEISEIDSDEEKENMLIVISDSKIKDSYGAKKIIEAPNHQYFLQYNSEEEKKLALEKLKEDNRIDSVEENGVYTTLESDYNSWGIEKMALDHAITSANANSDNMQQVTVAIIDTGCDMTLFNKYYGGKISEYYNVLEQSTTVMSDEDGHGTHVAGTIAEGTPDNVKILPIKVSRTGTMYDSDIIAAINYIVYNNKAQVINMSFGGYSYNEALDQAIEAAKEQNIISVAAAGNDNVSVKHYPSSHENTISIASVDSNLNKSSFSNYGETITFAAPGTNIKSIMGKDALISRSHGNNDDDDHEIISGTSMATPHAAAAVAILKGYNKDLTFENVVDILKDNAQDLGEKGWDQYYGYGLISFKDVEFCDGTYCDELGIYKDLNKYISNINMVDTSLTKYNYYSETNLMGIMVKVNYSDGTSEEMTVGNLPNVEVLEYDPLETGVQFVTIKMGNITRFIQVTNPDNYESGWEYNDLGNGKIEITGYKNHDLSIDRLYVPETIDSKQVVAFADNFKFAESGSDIESYTRLYLPSTFTRIGDYALAGTNIKYIYGAGNKIEVGAHAFEGSEIVSIDIPITKVEDYAFKDCFELVSIKVWEEKYSWNTGNALTIGDYAFYNCKKLATIEMPTDFDSHLIGTIGQYAFYNCISLAFFDLEPISDIGEYAFYNTFLLSNVDLYNVDSIGQYAFYSSGISEVSFSIDFEVVNESAFENCKNLKKLSFLGERIETRAFWGSGIEKIFIGHNVEYISEDAFAYTPMKNQEGTDIESGNYKSIYGFGVVETSTNKLIIGFPVAQGVKNYEFPDYVTEIGNYAFTGNNNLEKIVIPATVTKIGTHAFEDCYKLSDVYMLGSTINFGNDTFKRNYEGELADNDLTIYVYKDSDTKQIVKSKGFNYRHFDPDEVIVGNYESSYKALTEVDDKNLLVKFVYHEEEDREEILNRDYYGIPPIIPATYGIGFYVAYQTPNTFKFQYGDTHFTVVARNVLGYSTTKDINVTVEKATPEYTVPTGLTALVGQQLSEVSLPEHFEWMDGSQTINSSGEVTYKARYIPTDTNNYETVENIDVTITVSNGKTTINPEIIIDNKTYDGTTDISTLIITVSNLENSEYSVVSAISSSADVGERSATVVLRLSNEKFENYAFSNGQQEMEFTVNFKILKATINVTDNSKNVIVKYDGKPHSVDINIVKDSNATIKYMDSNNEYTLDEVPTYTNIGEYTIKYKVYINDNYTEYNGQKILTIEDGEPYTIKDYNTDTTNKYISKITPDTKLEDFIASITLNTGYTVEVDSKTVDNKQVLYTGGKTKIYKNSVLYIEYTNVVSGDINGDGATNSADLLKIRQHLLEINTLLNEYFLSSDINNDGTINSADLLMVRKHLLGTQLIA